MSFWMQTAVFGGFQHLGAAYPEGGPQRIALACAQAVEAHGGAVCVRSAVSSILLDASGRACGVRLASGDELESELVISGLGYRATLALLPAAAAPPRALRSRQSCGFVMANVALEGSAEELGISCANMWLQPAAEANGYDAIGAIDAFMKDPLGVPVEWMPMGITFPSCKDAAHRQPERHTCQVLVPCEWSAFAEHWPSDDCGARQACFGGAAGWARHMPPHAPRRQPERYAALKQRWADRILELLCKHYPKLEGRVVFCDVSTPLSIEYYLRSGGGGAIGLDVTPARFLDEAELKLLDMRHPSAKGLWMAGQDALMCGQVNAAAAGLLCALRLLGPAHWLRFGARAVRLLLVPALLNRIRGCAGHKSNKSE